MCGLKVVMDEYDGRVLGAEHHFADIFNIDWVNVRFLDFYGETAFPNMFFDGMENEIGAGDCDVSAEIYREKIERRFAETDGVSAVAINGSCAIDGNQINITASFELVDDAEIIDAWGTLLIVEDGLTFQDEAYDNTTRYGGYASVPLVSIGDIVQVDRVIALDPGWDPANLRCIVFLQTMSGDLEIYQAAELHLGMTGVGADVFVSERTRIDAIWPNPYVHSAESGIQLRLALSETDRHGPLRFEILDIRGRRVRELDGASGRGNTPTILWDGCDDRGRPVASGVYLARLRTAAESVQQRLVLLR